MGPPLDAPKAPIGAYWTRREHAGDVAGAPFVGRGANAACGDELVLALWPGASGSRAAGVVRQARYRVRGCSSLIALAEWTCRGLEGLALADLAAGGPTAPFAADDLARRVAAAGGLPPRGTHALGVLERALREALRAVPARREEGADEACSAS